MQDKRISVSYARLRTGQAQTLTLSEYRSRAEQAEPHHFDDYDVTGRTERPNVRRPALGGTRVG